MIEKVKQEMKSSDSFAIEKLMGEKGGMAEESFDKESDHDE
jgi:hypothetical protein